ncbi:neural cell adhesion molecule 1 isoform X2 [Austrofundulus limnaeus]|uniref:Neural cell adhesion molecule 1 isoform X2 n=1 Tax=Austrofundulus limnaeus TaxID=52670 RepID=A0A2I4ATK7_AUSLI|nr:PREDICTED: neural cell adhesion molecule 1-like isoform X2 [Austrofundulus limnaeus]
MLNQSTTILRITSLLLLLVGGTEAKLDIISSRQDYRVGEEILLLCKASGDGEIKWHKDGEEIDDEDIVSKLDYTSSKLLIKKAKMQDAGKYTCECEFDSGHKSDEQIVLYIYDGPSFGSKNTYHEFLEGTDGVVPCLVTGLPAVDVHWLRDKQDIPSAGERRVRKMPDNSLYIEKVQRKDAGTYVCQAQIRGRPISQQLTVSVVVNAPPSVRLREEVKKVMAGPETNVSLLCLVDGLPKPNITWTMPVTFDPFHHQFNSDRSQLSIQSVARADFGEYICTATNKIGEHSATIVLHVFEAPEVFVSVDQQRLTVGEHVSVFCNVTGHPQPELHWLNKQNGQTLDSTGRVRAEDGVLVIDEIVPSDGGLYSCMAVSASGNASRDVAIQTQPGPPHYLSVSPGPTSVVFELKTFPISGGTPISGFVLQWRKSSAEEWKEIIVPTTDRLAITSLKPYTTYLVRMAALNAVGQGQFSIESSVHTEGIREPDSPVLSTNEMKVEGNSFSVPIRQIDDGGSPLLHFDVRYKQDTEGSEWKENELPSDADAVSLKDLVYGSDYKLEVKAVNANGSSLPFKFNFTIAEQSVSSSMTKGGVVGIVMVIFVIVFLVVDATCCYRNRCGLLMTIAVKLFGQKVPGLKMVEEGEGNTNGELKLKGIDKPGGSLQQTGTQTLSKESGQLSEVTCDKAPLTKHEKIQPPTADA